MPNCVIPGGIDFNYDITSIFNAMKKRRCKECSKFCTVDCRFREDVDTMTFECPEFKETEAHVCGENGSCLIMDGGVPKIIFPDTERDKWTK